jgi:hypothetical protein
MIANLRRTEKLNPDRSIPVVIDRGIATADSIEWLIKSGFKYIVANREENREFDSSKATCIRASSDNDNTVSGYKEVMNLVLSDNKNVSDARVIYHSLKRQKKEEPMN